MMKIFAACALALSLTPLALAETSLEGAWSGEYICGQGLTNMRMELELVEQAQPGYKGTFAFSAHETNPEVPSGEYAVFVRWLEEGVSFEVIPTQWIAQPDYYKTVGMVGVMAEDGASMSGLMASEECPSFAATREQEAVEETVEARPSANKNKVAR